jgi:hypothetical protein
MDPGSTPEAQGARRSGRAAGLSSRAHTQTASCGAVGGDALNGSQAANSSSTHVGMFWLSRTYAGVDLVSYMYRTTYASEGDCEYESRLGGAFLISR